MGNFMGASASGAMGQALGVRAAATVFAALFFCLTTVDVLAACRDHRPSPEHGYRKM